MCTAVGPAQRRPARRLRRPGAQGRLRRHDQPRAAAPHGRAPAPRWSISTGMSTEAEIRESVDAAARPPAPPYALLHCQSTYPAPFKDVNLRYLTRLAEIGQCPVGYSGHERGFHVPLAAVALGAQDHREALHPRPRPRGQRPQGQPAARRVRRDGRSASARSRRPWARAAPRAVSTGEMMNRVNLAKSLVAARGIEAGETHRPPTPSTSRAPAAGLQPNALDRLVGRTASRALRARRLLLRHRPRRRRAAGSRLRLPSPVGPAGALPRHRGDDRATAPPTSSSSTSPTRTSRSTRPSVLRDRPAADGLRLPRARPLRRRLPPQPRQRGRRPLGALDHASSSGSST